MQVYDSGLVWTEPKDVLLSELKTFVAHSGKRGEQRVLLPGGIVMRVDEESLTPELFLRHRNDRFFSACMPKEGRYYGFGLCHWAL